MDVKCLHYRFADKTDAVMAVDAHTFPSTIKHHIKLLYVYGRITQPQVCKEAERQMEE